MAGQEIDDIKLSTCVKILAFLCGIALIGIGITQMSFFAFVNPAEFFLALYYILFGILVCLAELPWQKTLTFFSFLKTYIGRGLFLLFLATLVFDYGTWWYLLVAITLFCVAIFYLALACTCSSKLKEPKQKQPADNQKNEGGPALKPLDKLELMPPPLQAPVLPPPPPKV